MKLKDECHGFTSTICSESVSPCCACAFDDCPLEAEGCELILKKCYADEPEYAAPEVPRPEFSAVREAVKLEGSTGSRIPIQINT